MRPPLEVELDGTLIRTDLLAEGVLQLARRSAPEILAAARSLVRGRAAFTTRVAELVEIDPATLPYDTALLDLLRSEQKGGRTIVLSTASPERWARQVAEYLGIFTDVVATSHHTNLRGVRTADLAVWLRAMRVHQWVKNLLVIVPMLAAHSVTSLRSWLTVGVCFLALGFIASSVYLLNDLLDVPDDRKHRSKCSRAFAAGDLDPVTGVRVCLLLLVVGLLLGSLAGRTTLLALAGYYTLTLAYSLWLKGFAIVDVVVLASLYTTRLAAGAFAAQVRFSFWLLAFSVCLFFGLALLKRYSELRDADSAAHQFVGGRGYLASDAPLVGWLGTASGTAAVLVLALYINSAAVTVLYRTPELLWMACPLLLFWISRAWLIASRGKMHDDPVLFALKDKTSWVVGAALALVVRLAT